MALEVSVATRLLGENIPYLCLAAIISLAIYQVLLWYPLRHIPGPTSAGWSMWWQFRACMGGEYDERLREVADKYGGLIQPWSYWPCLAFVN